MSDAKKIACAFGILPPCPIPESLGDSRHTRLSLDGEWRFQPAPGAADYSAPESPEGEGWQPIQVPGEWFMQGHDIPPDQPVLYRRTFELPAGWEEQRVRLRFDAVHSACRVWVNGHSIGAHEGPFEAFEFDVTHAIKSGTNTLTVEVTSYSQSDFMSLASEYASHPLGGIGRKVTLFPVPSLHPLHLFPVTTRAEDGTWSLALESEWILDGDDLPENPAIDLILEDPSSHAVIASGRFELPLLEKGRCCRTSTRLPVEGIKPWDCEHPNLYKLTLRCPGASYGLKIGFREVRVEGNKLLVNGSPVKLRGVNRHEVHPTRGRANCADLARGDVELFRSANINFIRTCHYPPPEEFLDACDELGMFVESEAALCWVNIFFRREWEKKNANATEFTGHHLRANAANVLINRHHPCILFWSLGNESEWNENFALAQEVVRDLDPHRPTIFHNVTKSGDGRADITNCHYTDPVEIPTLLADLNKPMLLGEHGHVQCYNRREIAADPGVRDEWGRALESLFAMAYRTDHVLGVAIWAAIDDVFYPKNRPGLGYGPWGIVDGWRREKPEFWHVKKVCSPVRIALEPGAAGDNPMLSLWNRHDFTDLSELVIRWKTRGLDWQILPVALPPRSHGETPLPIARLEGALEIRVEDGDGRLIDEEKILFPETSAPPPILLPEALAAMDRIVGPVSLSRSDVECFISPESGEFRVSGSGRIYLAEIPRLVVAEIEELSASGTTNDYAEDIIPLTGLLPAPHLVSAFRLNPETGSGIHLDLSWEKGKGGLTILFGENGALELHGKFAFDHEMKPRQYGVALCLPGDFEIIGWSRTGLWSSYPGDHIGRLHGNALAEGKATPVRESVPHAWSSDDSPLGSNDFRATRTGVHTFTCWTSDGRSIELEGRGTLAARAWREGEKTFLLVTEYSGGGSEPFTKAFYAAERIVLAPEQEFQTSFRIHLH